MCVLCVLCVCASVVTEASTSKHFQHLSLGDLPGDHCGVLLNLGVERYLDKMYVNKGQLICYTNERLLALNAPRRGETRRVNLDTYP